jgi:polyisoprenyl-phosphate glycosyltransferase
MAHSELHVYSDSCHFMSFNENTQVVVMMPVYEDWELAIELCRTIDRIVKAELPYRVSVLLIDDGSTAVTYQKELPFCPQALEHVSVLVLRRNVGHQRAIAIGLTHLQQQRHADIVVVMDADGEDRPEDIPRLIGALQASPCPIAVFAERGKRLEVTTFRVLYNCYRMLHKILTGRDMRFGNFSALPWSFLDAVVVFPELWNHYAATIVKSRLPYSRVRADRGARLKGHSRMNFISLVVHGMSALFANQELVGTRMLLIMLASVATLFVLIAAVVAVKLLTTLAIPGWATMTMGLLLILITQMFVAAFILVFSIMMNRSQLSFLPVRDYSHFIRCEDILYPR